MKTSFYACDWDQTAVISSKKQPSRALRAEAMHELVKKKITRASLQANTPYLSRHDSIPHFAWQWFLEADLW
jgi:hypothetical protein